LGETHVFRLDLNVRHYGAKAKLMAIRPLAI
jgi:hypothetical protein